MARRRLIVWCPAGLANRLRLLTSARVMARATGRELTVVWPLTSQCNCAYERLLLDGADVEVVAPGGEGAWTFVREVPDVLSLTQPEVRIGHHGWIVQPRVFPHHRELVPALEREVAALTPTPGIAARVEEVAARFRREMIGVHLRRGDFVMRHPTFVDNTGPALALTTLRLRERPDAGIFLATDDGGRISDRGAPRLEGAAERFRARWGERVVTTRPRSLDRDTPEAIEDALVDLLLLRRTDHVIGTVASTFTHFAGFGRGVPMEHAPGETPRMRAVEVALARVGLRGAFMALARLSLGADVDSFTMAWTALRRSPEGEALMRLVARARDRFLRSAPLGSG